MASTPTPNPSTYVVQPTLPHKCTIILLHGRGSNGPRFGQELLNTGTTTFNQTLTTLFPSTRFIFPTATRRRSVAFNRAMLTQWFDIARLSDLSYRQDVQLQGLGESAEEILGIVEREVEIVGAANVVLGGLSQGCAMSMAVLLTLEFSIGGFIGMSGFLAFAADLKLAMEEDDEEDPFSREDETPQLQDAVVKAQAFQKDLLNLPPSNSPTKDKTAYSTPVFLGHGAKDEKVPCERGEQMVELLRAAQYDVEWRCYEELGHWYKIPDEIDDIVRFLREKVGWEVNDGE